MDAFNDVLTHNAAYAQNFCDHDVAGIARRGLAVITCMDSRIDPMAMLGLALGDAKILRTPGGRVTDDALTGCILAVHLLQVDRIMVVAHTRCAMASGDDAQLGERIWQASGVDLRGMSFGACPDQAHAVSFDVELLRHHPGLAGRAEVGGFLYDVDTGLLSPQV